MSVRFVYKTKRHRVIPEDVSARSILQASLVSAKVHYLVNKSPILDPHLSHSNATGDQKVSVHLMITIQTAGAERLIYHPV